MHRLLYISLTFLLVTLVTGCGRGVDSRLVLADSLMWTRPDSSLAILEGINRDSLQGDENLAYHALLLTQAQFRVDYAITSDSLINLAVEHYSDNHNREHHTRTFYIKVLTTKFTTTPLKQSSGTSKPKTTPTPPTTATSRRYTCAWKDSIT